jgi:transposase InsO family protein
MYREVTMIEFKGVLRLWHEQVPKKRIAARLGMDPKTVRRYLSVAEAAGLRAPVKTLSEERVREVLLTLQPNQLWSWDITKLLGPKKWTYFYLYVLLDVFSRYVTGWMVVIAKAPGWPSG